MRQLFLHIGFNKTGSTSLQKAMFVNASALEHHGILYPSDVDAPYVQRWQHVPLAAAVPGCRLEWVTPRKMATLNDAYSNLHSKLRSSDHHTVVLSSEGFGETGMGADKLKWLKNQFSEFRIKIVAYVRRQDHYFLSTYQEAIKAGRHRKFNFDDFSSFGQLYFGRRLAPWREVFGFDNVIVRPFTPAIWPEKDLVSDFFKATSINVCGIEKVEPENEGLDFRAVEFLRILNSLQKNSKIGRITRPRARKLAVNFSNQFALNGGLHKMRLSSEQINILREHFREDNSIALASSGVDPDQFFPAPPEGQQTLIAPPRLSQEALMKFIFSSNIP